MQEQRVPLASAVSVRFCRYRPLLPDLWEAVAIAAAGAMQPLRSVGLLAQRVTVWLTAPHAGEVRFKTAVLPTPMADAAGPTIFARDLLDDLYEPGVDYREVGVVCDRIAAAEVLPLVVG